jgi:hypothetical protein
MQCPDGVLFLIRSQAHANKQSCPCGKWIVRQRPAGAGWHDDMKATHIYAGGSLSPILRTCGMQRICYIDDTEAQNRVYATAAFPPNKWP